MYFVSNEKHITICKDALISRKINKYNFSSFLVNFYHVFGTDLDTLYTFHWTTSGHLCFVYSIIFGCIIYSLIQPTQEFSSISIPLKSSEFENLYCSPSLSLIVMFFFITFILGQFTIFSFFLYYICFWDERYRSFFLYFLKEKINYIVRPFIKVFT